MGYRSDVYIGIEKSLYAKAILLNNIPKCLFEVECHRPEKDQSVIYWFIEGWKWYESYPDIQEMEAWFDWCMAEQETLEDEEPYIFGAIRLGEDGEDVTEWGHPAEFDLYINRYINRP